MEVFIDYLKQRKLLSGLIRVCAPRVYLCLVFPRVKMCERLHLVLLLAERLGVRSCGAARVLWTVVDGVRKMASKKKKTVISLVSPKKQSTMHNYVSRMVVHRGEVVQISSTEPRFVPDVHPYSCHECDQTFRSRSAVWSHVAWKHPSGTQWGTSSYSYNFSAAKTPTPKSEEKIVHGILNQLISKVRNYFFDQLNS